MLISISISVRPPFPVLRLIISLFVAYGPIFLISVRVQGFCLPAEMIEDGEGDGATKFEDIESGGLGEGEGAKDVSDQIETEDQVRAHVPFPRLQPLFMTLFRDPNDALTGKVLLKGVSEKKKDITNIPTPIYAQQQQKKKNWPVRVSNPAHSRLS